MGAPLRLLIIEDSEDDCALIVRELKRGGYEPAFKRVDSQDALKPVLALQDWDLVISDFSMPQFSPLPCGTWVPKVAWLCQICGVGVTSGPRPPASHAR